MPRFQRDVLRAHGYRPGKRCGQEHTRPSSVLPTSLTDLFATAGGGGAGAWRLLDSVPPYFSQGVVTGPPDREPGLRDPADAACAPEGGGGRHQGRLDPPAGVEAAVVGLPVLAAEANGALSSPLAAGLVLLAALLGVFLVLCSPGAGARSSCP